MGLDATFYRAGDRPLGSRREICEVLGRFFPGVEFGWAPSGAEKLEAMRSRGIELPGAIREHFTGQPAEFEGLWAGPGWSVEFYFGEAERIEIFHAVLRGDTTKASPVFQQIQSEVGWSISHP
jgi:hypothetical protein